MANPKILEIKFGCCCCCCYVYIGKAVAGYFFCFWWYHKVGPILCASMSTPITPMLGKMNMMV